MKKKVYCEPQLKVLHVPFANNLLLNLSVEGVPVGYEGDELDGDFEPMVP